MKEMNKYRFSLLILAILTIAGAARIEAQSVVSSSNIERWRVTNGFYALNIFEDGTILAASDTFVSGAGSGVQLNPRTGAAIRSFSPPDVRTSIRLSSGDQNWVVGGYAGRAAVRQDGSFVRHLMQYLGCCNIPRFPMALDSQRDTAFVLANGELFGANMTTGALEYHYYGAGDTFGMISIANTNLLYTAGRGGNVTRLHPVNGRQWAVNIASGDLQPGAVTSDDSFIVSSGSPHFANSPQPGRLARILPDGTVAWNNMVNAVTPPVIGSNGLIFVGTQSAPLNPNGAGAIEAYNPADGSLAWSASVTGLPNDLLVGDDGAVYAGTGGFNDGSVYVISQTDGTIRRVITNVPGAWEIVLRAGLLYASGNSITAIPVDAVNYDLDSPWAVRFHDNQRTGNRQTPILTPQREPDFTNIDPQAFAGTYRIYNTDSNTLVGAFSGAQTLNLAAGNYLFDNGNGVGDSAFNFAVNSFGQVTSVSNPNAAEAVGNTLRLRNVTININPQAYAGNYYFGPRNVFYTGARSFTVVPGLRYGIDSGAGAGGAGGTSYFYFDVGAGGAISNIDVPAAAYGDANTLYFNNRTLIVEPNAYTGLYNISSHSRVASSFSGRQSFVLIPGLIYTFDTGTGFYEQRFKLEADGAPTNIEPAGFASGTGNVLSLANVTVHVDPLGYGGVYRLSGRTFSGAQDLALVPYTRFFVAVNNAAEYATPTPNGVTPPSVTLNDNGNSYTFNFFLNEACTMPSSGIIGWWSGEGNGSPRVGNNLAVPGNGAQFGAGKVGQSFQFDGVNDYVDIGSFGVLPTYTVALWFNADVADTNRTFISQDREGVNDDFMLGIEPEGHYYTNDFGRITVVFQHRATQSRYKIRDTVDVAPGRWYFVAVTYDGVKMRLWVDGIEKGSVTMNGLAISDQRWNLGQNSHYFPIYSYRNFAGRIDEPLIASRAFTQSEINGVFMSGYSGACTDSTAPTTSAAASPAANAAGWFNSDVGLTLNADDGADGAGVNRIVYSASGAQTIAPTTANAAVANLAITAEGETVITYYAVDNAGNTEEAKTLTVKVDKTAPDVDCGAPDGAWHAADVSINCTATENVSGLANGADANFTLVTNVPAETETDNALTDSRSVCDVAGNCATAEAIGGNKVDKKAPVITIIAPTAGNYLLNQAVAVDFECTDGGSGVASCTGTTADGGWLDTAATGAKTFTVNSSDNVGNGASPVAVNYTVGFGIQVLFDQTKAHKSGSTVPIKIRLTDANGVNVSAAATIVHAVSVVQTGSQASTVLEDSGNANPDFDFRYDEQLAGYIFNLQTKGYTTGTYQLNFIAANGAVVYSAQFQVRQ